MPSRCWLLWVTIPVLGCGEPFRPGVPVADIPVYAEVIRVDTVVGSSGDGYDLFDASHVRTLSDGRLVVLNAGSQEILVYSPSGTLANRFGGPGDGPGEFSHPWFLTTLPGDSILVTDRPLPQRSVLFTSSGEVARTFTLETPQTGTLYVLPRAITDDGVIVASQALEPVEPGSGPGVRYVEIQLVTYDLSGRLLTHLSHPEVGVEYWLVEVDGRLRSTRPPFLRQGFAAAGGPGLVLAASHSPHLLWLSSDGSVRDTIRTAFTAPSLVDGVVDSVRGAWAESPSTERGRVVRRRILGDLPVPSPALTAGLEFDRAGRLWVAPATATGARGVNWILYAGDSLLGRVELPTGVEIRELGAEHVLAVGRDSLGVETILRFALRIE